MTLLLTLLWIACPSVGAEDSLNISAQYHYEAEIVFAHTRWQAGFCLGKSTIQETHLWWLNTFLWDMHLFIQDVLTVTLFSWEFWLFYLIASSRESDEKCWEQRKDATCISLHKREINLDKTGSRNNSFNDCYCTWRQCLIYVMFASYYLYYYCNSPQSNEASSKIFSLCNIMYTKCLRNMWSTISTSDVIWPNFKASTDTDKASK